MRMTSVVLCMIASLGSIRADSLKDILARMDKDAPNFHALTADLTMDEYKKIIDSHTVQNGNLQMQRSKKGEVTAIITFTGADNARTVAFKGKSARIYYPVTNLYQDANLGSSAAVVNQLLLLGFGSSGKDLEQSYNIQEEGQEQVSGQATTKLLLTPKDPAVLKRFIKVELWIPDNGSNPIRQEFYESSGNYRLITYSNMHVNPPMSGPLELKMAKGAKKQSQ